MKYASLIFCFSCPYSSQPSRMYKLYGCELIHLEDCWFEFTRNVGLHRDESKWRYKPYISKKSIQIILIKEQEEDSGTIELKRKDSFDKDQNKMGKFAINILEQKSWDSIAA